MIDLLQLIGRDTTLRRTCAKHGGEFSGACPICRCGTDRFKVWPQLGRWACLGAAAGRSGCDLGGDAIEYLRQRDGLRYREACERLGVEVQARGTGAMNAKAQWAGETQGMNAGARWAGGAQGMNAGARWASGAQGISARAQWARGAEGVDGGPRGRGMEAATAPSRLWQARARAWADACAQRLWSAEGERALAWLHGRGLEDAVLRRFQVGYQDRDLYEEPALWGAGPSPGEAAQGGAALGGAALGGAALGGGPRAVWLPRGITLPWMAGGVLWRVNVRRPLTAAQVKAGEAKYMGPAGFGNGLYNADALAGPAAAEDAGLPAHGALPALLVEGEFDALTVVQACGNLAAAVATGSTAGGRRARWAAPLACAPVVLVAFDRDEAGEKAAAWWLATLPNARRWRPLGHDVNEQPQPDAVRRWLLAGLAAAGLAAGDTGSEAGAGASGKAGAGASGESGTGTGAGAGSDVGGEASGAGAGNEAGSKAGAGAGSEADDDWQGEAVR